MHSVVALLSSSLVGVREGDGLTDYLYTTTISIRPVPHAIDRDVVYKVKQPTASRGSTAQQQQQSSRSRDAYREEQQGFYRPAVFVDEIGLTSDKYVVLNETVRELPLKISFGPLSLQVRVTCAMLLVVIYLMNAAACRPPTLSEVVARIHSGGIPHLSAGAGLHCQGPGRRPQVRLRLHCQLHPLDCDEH